MSATRIDGLRPSRKAVSLAVLAAAGVGVVAASCGDDGSLAAPSTQSVAVPTSPMSSSPPSAVIDPGDDGAYRPDIAPDDFVESIDHPYLPMQVGTRWVYRETTADGETERIEVEVLSRRRTVMGVSTVVVHDVVSADGEIIEDTYDWFAQDRDGNVWYFGEDTTAYEDGKPDTEGSWEAGVDGALPGIAMPAQTRVTGVGYRQEYLEGEAEDMGQVIATDGSSVTTPSGTYDDVITTRDWTPLEPDVVEEKTYARGVGMVHESKPSSPGDVVDLIEFESGLRR